jgi:hypothetical protein
MSLPNGKQSKRQAHRHPIAVKWVPALRPTRCVTQEGGQLLLQRPPAQTLPRVVIPKVSRHLSSAGPRPAKTSSSMPKCITIGSGSTVLSAINPLWTLNTN